MSDEESEERPTPPARIGHEFEKPIVEELPRETQSARERTGYNQAGHVRNRTKSVS
jgi:hypothetical protein